MPQASSWTGTPSIKGSSESMRMALLTASLIGIQFTWGIEMTYCTPYLLQLGLSKSRVSLVWIAGPLSGLIVQPVVGILADKSQSKFGRRRPFMIGGSVVVAVALLVLGRTWEIVGALVTENETRKSMTIALAVMCIYVVDFAINAGWMPVAFGDGDPNTFPGFKSDAYTRTAYADPTIVVQGSCRSLIVDTLPVSKQQLGQAWASRMIAVGHLIGYGIGAVHLEDIFGNAMGDTQFKQLTVIAAMALILCVSVTSFAVRERILVSNGKLGDEGSTGAIHVLTQIFKTATNLPDRIASICWIQFWAWIGWFPFLFYSTTWVGEIYIRYEAPMDAQSQDTLGQMGRVGSMSLVVFSLITFVGSIVLPWVVKPPEDEKRDFTPRPPASLAPVVAEAEKYKPTLLTAWMLSHLIFTCSMLLAPMVSSLRSATIIVAICGIPWALACWAPFTFMGIEINRLGTNRQAYRRLSNEAIEMGRDGDVLRLNHAAEAGDGSTGELSGVYLGILNLFTTLPQFVGTFISWVVFSLLEPGKSPELAKEAHPSEHHSTDGPNGIAVCLFIGALSAAVAAHATSRLRRVA